MFMQIFGAKPALTNHLAFRRLDRALRIGALIGGFTAAAALATPAAAQSLSSGPCGLTGETATFNGGQGLTLVPFATGGGINTLVSAINVSNTAFLSQSTAFIGSPPNPEPWQLGGGVWARGIGGQTDFKSTSTSTYTFGGAPLSGNITCNTTTKLNFSGVQIGTDIATLNIDGWNIHGGSTLGYMGAYAFDSSPGGTFQDSLQIPFVGIYGAATKGGLFIDGQARWNYYQNKLTDRSNGLFGQNVDARGFSINGNIGYNFDLPQNWFAEPSAGFLWSKVWVDPFNAAGTLVFASFAPGAFVTNPLPGTISVDNIYSALGRVSLRVGTNIVTDKWILQPFATISGYREFVSSNSASLNINATSTGPISAINPGVGFTCFRGGAPVPCTITGNLSATNIGNYGQFGLGVVGVLPNTGWLGYVRADYRTGDRISGWAMNGGLRYQINPDRPVITGRSADVPAMPATIPAYNWTGFYLGPSLGIDWGYSDWTFVANGSKTYPRFAGILPGGQIGYDYQYGKWVFGIEGSMAWTNAHGARPCPGFFFNCEINLNYLATVTGRIGLTYPDRVLWYAKGGLAIGEVNAQARCNTDSLLTPFLATGGPLNPGCPVQGTSVTKAGWTIGGGSELGLTDNWSVKAETSYFDLGSSNHSFGFLASPLGANVRTTGWISTIGLNYRFTGFGAAPALAAKY